jgi:oligopeptide transport system substrate-binding protein
LCVDAPAVTKKLATGGEVSATSFIPPGMNRYQPAKTSQKDFYRARQLMAQAGYPGGKGFPLVHYIYTESELNSGIAVELQSVWEKVLGVRVLLNRQEWKVCLNSMNQLDYDIASSTWIGDYPDPNTFLDIFMTDAGNNRTGWSSSRYDQLLKEATTCPDSTRRMNLLRQAESMLITHGGPIIPIFYLAGIQLYDPKKLGGMGHNLLNKNPISEIYVKKR